MTMREPNDSYLRLAQTQAMDLYSGMGIVGHGTATLYAPDGSIKQCETFANKITDYGDLYYATRVAQGIAPTSLADIVSGDLMTGMKLGTNSAATAKAGAGAALNTYFALSNLAFTSVALVNGGSGLGYQVVYTCNWTTSVVLTAIVEAIIGNAAATNATNTAAHTIARVTFASITKNSTDTFAIQWIHTFLGAGT